MLKYLSLLGIAFSVAIIYETTLKKNQSLFENSIGQAVHSTNDTRIKKEGTLHWNQVNDTVPVHDGDTVFTGENSSTTLNLYENSDIKMNPNTIIIIRKDTIELEDGSLEINMKKLGKLKFLKIAGKNYPLNKPGTINIKKSGNEFKVELIPTDGTSPVILAQNEVPASQSSQPISVPITSVRPAKPAPVSPSPVRNKSIRTTPEQLKNAQINVSPKTETENFSPVKITASEEAETEVHEQQEDLPRPPRKWIIYVIGFQGSQKDQVSVTGTSSVTKTYDLSGSSFYFRTEVENLFARTVALSYTRNSFKNGPSTYKGFEFGADVILKPKSTFLKDFVYMPGLYLRQYTLELNNVLPGSTEASSVDSSSLMFAMTGRWEKHFETWVAELWPQIKIHSKSELLLDYGLLGGFGKETKVGRFSAFFRWNKNKDNLSLQNGEGDTSVTTTETKYGLGYMRSF